MSSSLPLVTHSLFKPKTERQKKPDLKLRIGQAFMSLVKGESLRDKWLTESCVLGMIKQRYPFRDASDFDLSDLAKAIFKVNGSIDNHGVTNTTGQFRLLKRLQVDGESSSMTRVNFYYISKEGTPYIGGIPKSHDRAAWKKFYDKAHAAGEERLTRSRARAKKARHWDDIDTFLLDFHSLENFDSRLKEATQKNNDVSVYSVPTYWASTEAKNLFCSKPGETVEDELDQKVELLDQVLNTPGGYKLILPGKGDPDNHYTPHEQMTLVHKAMHMRVAYKFALEWMDKGWTWGECCERAVERIKELGLRMGSLDSLQKWHRQYRKEYTLPHSNPFVATGIRRQPKLFEMFPQSAQRILSYGIANIDKFSIELIRTFLNSKLIPSLMEEYNEDNSDDEKVELGDFLEHELKLSRNGVSIPTVCRYLSMLGHHFSGRKKTYYVDGHERVDVVEARNKFCRWYLKMEVRCYRWVQLTRAQVDSLVEAGDLLFASGYQYDVDGTEMFEFHVDESKKLQDFVGESTKKRGGNLSVRKPPDQDPILMSGQDEAVYHQNAMGRRQWVLSDGRRHLLPKTDGDGKMASVFVSRD
jgi:hypothetical protein